MKSACVITVGNELLSGHTVNTNAAFLGRRLMEQGIPVALCLTVGDDLDQICQALQQASSTADLVVVSGGLGPTDDDLTRQAMAQFLGVDLVQDDRLLDQIRSFFVQRQREMPARNAIQAHLPAGTEAIENPVGTAPGVYAQVKDCQIFVVPGVPSEMEYLFEHWICPRVEASRQGQSVVVRRLQCFGVGESDLAEQLGTLMQRGRNPLINCTVHYGVITLHIIATADRPEHAEALAQAEEEGLRDLLGEVIYGQGQVSLAEVVVGQLAQAQRTLAVAESCTGGWIGKMLTDVPGSSQVFSQGWVTYSNRAKARELGVLEELLERYGAVSAPVARAMAQGARQRAATDVAIATTGIAGPGGGTPDKPVGLVYIALATAAVVKVQEYRFKGTREMVRWRTTQTAFNMIRRAAVF